MSVQSTITRRSAVAGLALAAAPGTVLAADTQDKQTEPEKSLYERLGGVFAIAAVGGPL
jgi:hemoglobin